MIGQTISHYKILEKLGEGGMGVVYKAQDLKLDRIVALKFLSPLLTADEGEKKRFEHEARAVSALDHPNICTIYEIGETEARESFIALAYYPGETLKQKIQRGPLKLDDAIETATQIAQGLARAHEAGIVHRDIKPANVMITDRNEVKIVDFGLAKMTGRTQITKTGGTVGTVAYMSPEQARGEKADHRTDIWSLGATLYEMITGQLPFQSEYHDAVVYSILNLNPQPLTGVRTGVPMELERIVVKTLQKNAGERYQSMNDLLVDLRALKKTMESGTKIISPPASHREPIEKRRTILLVASAVTALLLIGATVFLLLRSHPSAELNPNMTQRLLDIPFTEIGYPGLSADGNWAAFPATDARGKWDIYLMNTSGGEPRRITADSSAFGGNTDVSPDGSTFVYHVSGINSADIFTNSALGGVRRLLAESAFLPHYQPDGQRVFFLRGLYVPNKSGKLEIWSVKPDGKDERLEFIDSISVIGRISLSVSPDGKSVVWPRTFPEGGYQEVVIHNLVTGKEWQITFDKKNIDDVCWTRNDQIIFSSNKNGTSNLWMVPADGGLEVQITKGTGPDRGMKISSDGKKLLYFQNQDIGHVWISDLEGRNPMQVTSDDRMAFFPALSPDGNSIAVSLLTGNAFGGAVDLYLMKRDGSSRQQLTRSNSSVGFPVWSPDGKRLAFSVSKSAGFSFASAKTFILDIANPGKPVEVGRGVAVWWHDQIQLLVHDSVTTWRYSLDGSGKKDGLNDSLGTIPLPGNQYLFGFSEKPGSEGAWLYPVDKKKAASRLFRGAFPGNVQVAPNGKFLLYVKSPGELWKISLPDGKQERLPRNFPGLLYFFSISQDGKEIVYIEMRGAGKLVMIENLFK
jgi:serine/threonine protein kinase